MDEKSSPRTESEGVRFTPLGFLFQALGAELNELAWEVTLPAGLLKPEARAAEVRDAEPVFES